MIIKFTLKDTKQIALSRHRDCLSAEHKNIGELLIWRYQSNHQWQNSLIILK
ncbi:14229_t:CDS:2 [Funneliformis mosseae]|uniref:14229_t:CDS:1 n=1 Tax=Funneliformis mosseae TaxID=27381 RepID=A0A9N9G6D4_FUNMO|nr:14229_t:CDS:2 [Funneliformis mosseae]